MRPEAENKCTGEFHTEEADQSCRFRTPCGGCFTGRNPAGRIAGGCVSGRGSSQSVLHPGERFRNRAGSRCSSCIHFGRSGGAGAGAGRVHDRSERRNGFVCLVERSWAKATDDQEFWNPKVRAPICVNAAARTYLPIVLLKTKLVLAGKSRMEIARRSNRHWTRKNGRRWSRMRCAT
jgi:hypothetical protein